MSCEGRVTSSEMTFEVILVVDNPAPTKLALTSRRILEDFTSSHGNATGFSARRRPVALTEDSILLLPSK